MSAIWQRATGGWELLSPRGFPDEDTLHGLVQTDPQILPLSGNPQLVMLGREVGLGSGFADLVAVEVSGRVTVIEVKLRRNAEARRAVVAQVLTYAAYLRGLDAESFERDVLGKHLRASGHDSLHAAVRAADQGGGFEPTAFDAVLDDSLATGRFRLVIVLDEAPDELVRLVGYLEAVTDSLVIDLITVAEYEVGGTHLIVPQRIDPERIEVTEQAPPSAAPAAQGTTERGADLFESAIEEAEPNERPLLMTLTTWARQLEADGLCELTSFRGASGGGERLTLLPRLASDKAGLVTIWNDSRRAYLSFWRSVFERRAPRALARLSAAHGDEFIRQGNTTTDITEDLIAELTSAYREANGLEP
jgi:hypothetical protein